jgi:hypothetical protein
MTAKVCLHPDTTLHCRECEMEEELAAAQAEQRTAAQQGQGLVKPRGDSCSKPTTPVAAAAPQPSVKECGK